MDLENYPQMSRWVERFIHDSGTRTILEVGGRTELVEKWCLEEYQHVGKLSDTVRARKKEFDLIIALGVVERYSHYKKFLSWVMEMDPKFVVITFANDLSGNGRSRIRKDGDKHNNIYGRPELVEWLTERGLKRHRQYALCKAEHTILVLDRVSFGPRGNT